MSKVEGPTEDCDETVKAHEQPEEAECTEDDIPTTSQEARKGQRVRRLTEKGQELHDEQVKKAANRFSVCYEKWKAVTKDAKRAMDGHCSKDVLCEHVANVTSAANSAFSAYDSLRRIDSPDNDTRRRVDTCEAVTKNIVQAAERFQTGVKSEGQEDKEIQKDTDSVFKSAASARMSERSHHITYARDFIPANRDHIPTPRTAKAWPHLEHIADEIAPLQSCDVGLLIGYNCPQALVPRQVVSGKENQPFAQRTDLGWSIVGFGNPCLEYGDAFGVSHQVIVKQVVPGIQSSSNLTSEVHYVYRTQIKEMVSPADVIKMLESDFVERASEDVKISQEDLRFLKRLKEGIRLKEDGHFEMPLPFKCDRPNLPDNKTCAIHRLKCLERKLRRNEQYYLDYKKFMEEIIAHGDAEKVLEQDIDKTPAWYIPHHGVYHPQKPGRIRVVFDGSAKFQGTCINDHLLTGPELTNTLLGVLCRFRRGPVAIMCDIERMFHQFHVSAQDQDYLRFLWWENGNLDTPFAIYRMKVHLFGAASSPGCANYGLKHLATEGEGCFSEETIKFIKTNFYVDDGLASVETETQAIQLVKRHVNSAVPATFGCTSSSQTAPKSLLHFRKKNVL
ncbi:hypothetical protein WMY93_005649 [Mugilogobius chulae]|uniref:Uncharacterized protein n=1 Tax=Mugilogobius chulae TaxID=88201 RepID=A0AAW0PRG9_9GOBI